MAVSNLQQMFSTANLTGLINTVTADVPKPLPAVLYRGKSVTRQVEGFQSAFAKVVNMRRNASTSVYGAPSKAAPLADISLVPVTLMHTIENQVYGQILLQKLQGFSGGSQQRAAEQEVTRQTAHFKRRFDNLLASAVHSAIINQKIWFDSSGNLLSSSSGADATRTIDFSIPSTQTGAVTTIFSGASWDTAATDIIGWLGVLQDKAVQVTGYPLRYAIYGSGVIASLLKNTAATNLIQRNPAYNAAILAGQGGDFGGEFAGLTWIRGSRAFMEDSGGTVRTFIGANQVVFLPEITDDWYEVQEGSYLLPEQTGVVGNDAMAALGKCNQVYGRFSYATAQTDPLSIKQVMGDTVMPIIKNANVIWNITTTIA